MADGDDAPNDVSWIFSKFVCENRCKNFQSVFDLSKKKKKKKPRDDPTGGEKEGDENVSSEPSTTKEKKSKSVAFATESSEVRL